MLSFKRIFQTRQQALDAYKTQLSAQCLYVESFEAYRAGTEAEVELQIRETAQKITLNATVERNVGKAEAIEKKYGQRPGTLLHVPITQELVEPLRAFFLAQNAGTQPVQPAKPAQPVQSAKSAQSESPSAQPVRPVQPTIKSPFDNFQQMSPDEALTTVNRFLKMTETGSLYQLMGIAPNTDRKQMRQIYNSVVRVLHPDRYRKDFTPELMEKLGDAYQIYNEAYLILQSPVKAAIYLDISRNNHQNQGMPLVAYQKFLADYAIKNASNIKIADDFTLKAENALADGDKKIAAQHLKLALQYDPFHEGARSIVI